MSEILHRDRETERMYTVHEVPLLAIYTISTLEYQKLDIGCATQYPLPVDLEKKPYSLINLLIN